MMNKTRLFKSLIPYILFAIAWATRSWSIVGMTIVSSRDAGVNPCRIAPWGPLRSYGPNELPPLAHDWCVGMETDKMIGLSKHMIANTDPNSDISAAVDFGSNINSFWWRKEKRITTNFKIIERSTETIPCGTYIDGVKVYRDRSKWVVTDSYDILGDHQILKLTEHSEVCNAQLIEERYTRPQQDAAVKIIGFF